MDHFPSGGQVGWIGLQDFLVENTFSWADGAALGSFTNWANTQPDNNGVGQVRHLSIINAHQYTWSTDVLFLALCCDDCCWTVE